MTGHSVSELAASWPSATVIGDGDTVVSDVTHDSRRVATGSMFCCVVGSVSDGHDFAAEAVASGASALLVDHALDLHLDSHRDPHHDLDHDAHQQRTPVAQIVVDDVRAAMAAMAAAVHDHPSTRLAVVGVTGTNGKTTVVQLIGSIAEYAGRSVRTLGTLSGPRTTPEAPDLQATLAHAAASGVQIVAMEVSSHALSLHRVDHTHFTAGVFTNLGRDHLDFHGDLESYEAAKARLFSSDLIDVAVINTDDPAGRRIAARADVPVRPFGLTDVDDLVIDGPVSRFRWQGHEIELHLPGTHNVSNALAAAGACQILGIDDVDIADGLCRAQGARGRFEMVDVGQGYSLVVDYAHKPEALGAVLRACRQIVRVRPDGTPGRVIVVFGCGGDRDASKRPIMGRIAADSADVVVLTSDNPRSEEPERILDEIEAGVEGGTVERIADRATAIRRALDLARGGDVVLIAGKGDEVHQIIGDEVLPFDDREVAVAHLLGIGRTGSDPTESGSA